MIKFNKYIGRSYKELRPILKIIERDIKKLNQILNRMDERNPNFMAMIERYNGAQAERKMVKQAMDHYLSKL